MRWYTELHIHTNVQHTQWGPKLWGSKSNLNLDINSFKSLNNVRNKTDSIVLILKCHFTLVFDDVNLHILMIISSPEYFLYLTGTNILRCFCIPMILLKPPKITFPVFDFHASFFKFWKCVYIELRCIYKNKKKWWTKNCAYWPKSKDSP